MKKIIEFKYVTRKKITINEFLLSKGYSDNNIYYLISNENVIVDGNKIGSKNFMLEGKCNIVVILLDEKATIPATDKEIEILYEDKYLLAVNKKENLDVEPTINNYDQTLANYVLAYFNKNEIYSNIHLINRLDKLTSGIVLIAKNQYIHNLFKNVKISKKYQALVEGKTSKKGNIKIGISKDENSIKRIVDENGKKCETKYKLIKFDGKNSLVDIELVTGRTHQIRLSFASINHPLVGDSLYNPNYQEKDTMYLKAYEVSFVHPILKKKIKIKC